VDCGGDCPDCADGDACGSNSDCQSGVCSSGGVCQAPTCNDNTQNGDETFVDCGGSCTANCAPGQACDGPNDCTTRGQWKPNVSGWIQRLRHFHRTRLARMGSDRLHLALWRQDEESILYDGPNLG
jgi:hypothetical protein